MPEVITVGELLVEIMRKEVDVPLGVPEDFVGPFPSGAPAIFADAVARLGVSSGIIGGVGEDDFGDCIVNRLQEDGMDTSQIKRSGELSTGTAFVGYSSDGSRKFIYHMGNSAAGIIGPEDVDEDFVKGASVIHISGASLMMCEKMREACFRTLDLAGDAGLTVSFDPNVRVELMGREEMTEIIDPVLEETDLLVPGSEELKEICGVRDEEEGAMEMIERGVGLVAVKEGDRGCRIYTDSGTYESEAFEVEEIDPTGAGDAFSAAIVAGWLEGMDPEGLGTFANAVGAKAVTEKGPMEGVAWRKEVDNLIKDRS